MRKRALAAVFATSVAGCSLLVSTSDLDSERGAIAGDAGKCLGTECGDGAGAKGDGAKGEPCPSFALFCDDFESGSFAKWSSVSNKGGGNASVVTNHAHAGSHAMVANAEPSDASYGQAEANFVLSQPKKSGSLAVRTYVFMTKPLDRETTFMKIRGVSSDDMNVKIHATGVLKVDTDTPGAGGDKISAMNPPINRWFCLEWRATIGASGRQMLLLDGQVIVDAAENTETASGFERVSVGFSASDSGLSQEIYFDDVVIADQPIGCF